MINKKRKGFKEKFIGFAKKYDKNGIIV